MEVDYNPSMKYPKRQIHNLYPDTQEVSDEDYSTLGDFMVGEIKAVGEYDMKTGDLNPFDGGTSYAVMPESYIGEHDAAGLSGYQDEFSFTYASNILFYSEAPNGVFTDSDKQEVIQILSSFRVVE